MQRYKKNSRGMATLPPVPPLTILPPDADAKIRRRRRRGVSFSSSISSSYPTTTLSSSSSSSSMPSRIVPLAILLLLATITLLLHRTSFLPSTLNTSLRMSSSSSSSSSLGFQIYFAEAKEIVATHEWQRLSENDTIPAGLHVRMDLSTGGKWVKLVSDDEEEGDEEIQAAIHGESDDDEGGGGTKKKKKKVASAVMDASGALTIVENTDSNSNSNANNDNAKSTSTPPRQKDYVMMHRVMSQLPPEELDPYGGLPDLPRITGSSSDDNSAHTASTHNLTPKQRDYFEQQMELLWTRRQEVLKEAQESIADLPSMLKSRIVVIREYLEDAEGSLSKMVIEKRAAAEEKKRAEEEKKAEGAGGDYNEGESGEEPVYANNVIEVLRDLEFQLADVDMARDFHTLGGWPYLVRLLDDVSHIVHSTTAASEGDSEDDDDEDKSNDSSQEVAIMVDEIQALASMTIGTAVGNLGEFRPWALEDVSSSLVTSQPTTSTSASSALSLLISSFQNELSLRTQQMAGGSMAVPSANSNNVAAKYKSRATYKLRAIYALGSLLRGNPSAQHHFMLNGGAEILVSDVLGTLSNVRGTSAHGDKADVALTKLDYKFASKVLALGEDVVMDVILHQHQNNDEDDDDDVDSTTENQLIVAAFTSEKWCDLSLRMLVPPADILGTAFRRNIKERAMSAVRALGPGCKERYSNISIDEDSENDDGDSVSSSTTTWGLDEVRQVRSEWNREGDINDVLDSVYRRELLDLADGVIETLL